MFGTPHFSASSFADEYAPIFVTQAVTGQAVVSATQSVTVSGKANVSVTGQAAGSAIGSVTTSGKANVSVTGPPLFTFVGDVTLNVETVLVTGASTTVSISTPTVIHDHSVFVTGQAANAVVNAVPLQINLTANIPVTGNAIVSGVTAPNVYEDIEDVDTVSTTWTDIFNQSFTQNIASPYGGSAFSGLGFSSNDSGEVVARNPAPDGDWTEIEEASTIWEEIP